MEPDIATNLKLTFPVKNKSLINKLSTIRNIEIQVLPGTKQINQTEFEKEFETVFNGLPSIWKVDFSEINLLKLPK